MFSKNGKLIFFCIISCLFGAVVSYTACQYEYLEIDTEVKVIDTLIASIGLFLGLYLAIILEKQRNKGQNFYTYVEGKFDSLWQEFISLHSTLDYSSQIDLPTLSKVFKAIDKQIGPLKKILEASEHDVSGITTIETKIDELETYLSNLDGTVNNVLNIEAVRQPLTDKLNNINECFADLYKQLNDMS